MFLRLEITGDLRGFNRILEIFIGVVAIFIGVVATTPIKMATTPIKISKILLKPLKSPVISKRKNIAQELKKVFHICKNRLIEIPFHSEQVFNLVASTQIHCYP